MSAIQKTTELSTIKESSFLPPLFLCKNNSRKGWENLLLEKWVERMYLNLHIMI